jgi:hypothetical protein
MYFVLIAQLISLNEGLRKSIPSRLGFSDLTSFFQFNLGD